MANFPNILNYILGAVFIVLIFSISYAYLKPHLLHKSRPVSTLLLKASFLLYLLVLLIVVYLSAFVKGGLNEVFYGMEFFAFLLALFSPAIGILARKMAHFRKKRESYNYFFTVINILCLLAIIVMYVF